jgi:4,5-DOPA dioxygenase extradiol
MPNIMPVIFIGHGSPMNAIQTNDFTMALGNVSKIIEKPGLILSISAHWESDGTFITESRNPEQIYDFYGFPDELYEVKYAPEGSPEAAGKISKFLNDKNVRLDNNRGIDHGTWSILKHIYPEAEIPVIQISLDYKKTPEEHYRLGKNLYELRKENVLIIGSGNITHNLRMISPDQYSESITGWAFEFDDYIKKNLESNNDKNLINYKNNKLFQYAVPTNEHYLPLLYIAGLRTESEKIEYIYEGFQHSSLSMRSFIVR